MIAASPQYEGLRSGHSACPGCAHATTIRTVLRALGPRVVAVTVPSCTPVIFGAYPNTCIKVPTYHTAFETAASAAAGIAQALDIQGKGDIPVVAFAGDGGTFDIGLQSLSGAADRNENILYICLDNEAYMNTGVQVSSATPRFAWTGTSPAGNPRRKKQIMEVMAAHRIPYAATATIGFPEDLTAKVEKARHVRGTRFLHVLSPCVTGWKIPEHMAAKVAAMAVETNIFPLYEVEDGVLYRLTHQPRALPVSRYLSLQGRYRHVTEEQVCFLQSEADWAWEDLVDREDRGRARSRSRPCGQSGQAAADLRESDSGSRAR